MLIWNGLHSAGPREDSVITIGTFDGMHLGHKMILDATLSIADRESLRSVLLTFDPHPREVLRKQAETIGLLTTLDERLKILSGSGLFACAVLPFTRDLSMMDAEEFFAGTLVGKFGARHIVVGADHAFGHARRGRIEEMRKSGEEHGVSITAVPELTSGGNKVSSTAIRLALMRGDAREAANLLGRPYRLSGLVTRGDGLGRRIGYPTANVQPISNRKLVPLEGVYAAYASLSNQPPYRAMLNIGRRPTVSDDSNLRIEAHLLGFDGDLYGVNLDVDIIERMRDEKKFESTVRLGEQLDRDMPHANALLDEYDLITDKQ